MKNTKWDNFCKSCKENIYTILSLTLFTLTLHIIYNINEQEHQIHLYESAIKTNRLALVQENSKLRPIRQVNVDNRIEEIKQQIQILRKKNQQLERTLMILGASNGNVTKRLKNECKSTGTSIGTVLFDFKQRYEDLGLNYDRGIVPRYIQALNKETDAKYYCFMSTCPMKKLGKMSRDQLIKHYYAVHDRRTLNYGNRNKIYSNVTVYESVGQLLVLDNKVFVLRSKFQRTRFIRFSAYVLGESAENNGYKFNVKVFSSASNSVLFEKTVNCNQYVDIDPEMLQGYTLRNNIVKYLIAVARK